MADRRPEEQEMSRAKRIKSEDRLDPASNPYLAHMYNANGDDGYGSGWNARNGKANGTPDSTPLAKFRRHRTTAAQAHEAENGPHNPFNSAPLSESYFSILKTRRELPVHKQRYVSSFLVR